MGDQLAVILAELAEAAGRTEDEAEFLNPLIYHDPDLYALELDRIFRTEWICVARADQLEKVGDYIATQLLDEPLLIARRSDEELVTYSNVCRHRYYPVAEGTGNTKSFVCPYHKWTYRLDGSLVGAPGMEGTRLDKSKCQLPEIRTEVWNGFVFVNLDAQAEPLLPRISGLTERLAPYGVDEWRTVAIHDSPWQGNWKLTMENALDSYHHMGLHEHSIEDDMPGLGTEFLADHKSWAHHRTPFSDDYASRIAGAVPQLIARLAPEDRIAMNVLYIYPTFIMPLLPNNCNWLSLMPLSLTTTRVFTGLSIPKEAQRENLGVPIDEVETMSREQLVAINGEDMLATDHLQQTTKSRYIERGPMSRKEIGVHYYYRYLASRLIETS